MAHDPIIDVDHLSPETAPPGSADLLAQSQARLGFLPNMYGFMAQHPAILGGYLASYDAFRSSTGFTPTEQEVVFLTISRVNSCTYCMAAHSMIADKKSKVPPEVLAALRAGEPLPDAKLQALATFTETMLEKRGAVSRDDTEAFLAHGYKPDHALGIILAIAAKTYSNYTNHLTGPELDEVFAPYRVAP